MKNVNNMDFKISPFQLVIGISIVVVILGTGLMVISGQSNVGTNNLQQTEIYDIDAAALP